MSDLKSFEEENFCGTIQLKNSKIVCHKGSTLEATYMAILFYFSFSTV